MNETIPPFGIVPTNAELRVEATERGWWVCMRCGYLELNKRTRCGNCGFELPGRDPGPGLCAWCDASAEHWRFRATGQQFWLCEGCGGRDDNPCVERVDANPDAGEAQP